MSHPDPHHDPENVRQDDSKFAHKKQIVASKMQEPLSKAIKRFGRYMKKPSPSAFDIKGTGKSMRRHRDKEHLPF